MSYNTGVMNDTNTTEAAKDERGRTMRPLNEMPSDADMREVARMDDAVDRFDAAQAKLQGILRGMSRDEQMSLVTKLQADGVALPTKADNARMTTDQRADAVEAVVAAIEA